MNVTPTTVMRKFIALAIVVGAAILYNKLSCNHWPIESKVDSPSKTLRIPSATMTIAILTKLLEIRMVANKKLIQNKAKEIKKVSPETSHHYQVARSASEVELKVNWAQDPKYWF